jgi:regulatory protein
MRVVADDAYSAALRMLAQRELSEAQIRQRLARRGYDRGAVDGAVERLTSERHIDDARVAAVMARSETTRRKRGRLRVKRHIEAAGIAASVAQHAVDEAFRHIDADALMAAALERRLRGENTIGDDREFQRLYRYLCAQGFEPERVLALLRARRQAHNDD